MPIIIQALVLLFAILFMAISTVAGLLLIPLMLLSMFFLRDKPEYTPRVESIPDHHIHVPIDTVPPIYYVEYAIYLKSQQWRDLRQQVLIRDQYSCVDCGDNGRLQVHHLHYDGIETMTFTADQCVSVCHDCHDIRHGRDKWST